MLCLEYKYMPSIHSKLGTILQLRISLVDIQNKDLMYYLSEHKPSMYISPHLESGRNISSQFSWRAKSLVGEVKSKEEISYEDEDSKGHAHQIQRS